MRWNMARQVLPLCSFVLLATVAGSPAVAQETRPFLMSSGGIHVVEGDHGAHLYRNSSPHFPLSALAADVDVISIFPEHLGVPFLHFAWGVAPPATDPWTREMRALAAEAKATGKPILLQLTFARVHLVALATNNAGVLRVESGWAPACPNLAGWSYRWAGRAFQNYALWMAALFAPTYMVTTAEPNLYYANCGGDTPSWRVLAGVAKSTYEAVKKANPQVIAFPSFNLEAIYGQALDGFNETQWAALAGLPRDRLGLSTFPWYPGHPYALPLDYLTRIHDRYPGEPRIVITETAWNSETMSYYSDAARRCVDFLYSDASFQSTYLDFVIYSAYAGNFDLITWWSNRDMIDGRVMTTCYPPAAPPSYTECNGDFWCIGINYSRAHPVPWPLPNGELMFKAFGSMGLRNYDGTPKPGRWDTWQRFLALPVSAP
jgi:hypothetical protein